jgi:hypothetical protein
MLYYELKRGISSMGRDKKRREISKKIPLPIKYVYNQLPQSGYCQFLFTRFLKNAIIAEERSSVQVFMRA